MSKDDKWELRTCGHCGKTFPFLKGSKEVGKYCDRTCAVKARTGVLLKPNLDGEFERMAFSVVLTPYKERGFRMWYPFDRDLIDRLKLCLGAKYDKSARAWVAEGPEIIIDLERFGINFSANDPEAKRRIVAFQNQIERIFDLKRQENGTGGEYSFQAVGTQILSTQQKGILGDEMGLGKTKQTLDAIAEIGAVDILVIVEKTLMYKWEAEIAKWYPDWIRFIIPDSIADREAAIQVIEESGERAADARPRVIIVNYEKVRAAWWPQRKWDALLFDEAHKVKNRKTATHKAIAEIASNALAVFAITGTPLETKPEELFGVMSIARPSVFGEGISRFRAQHIDEIWEDGRSRIVFRNKDLLRERLAPWFTRRLKSDVQTQLPPKLYTAYKFDLSPGEKHFYDHFETLAESWLNAGDPLVQLLRFQQLTSSPYLVDRPDLGRGAKFDALKFLLDGWDSRALIFTRFRVMADYLRSWLELPERAIITGQVKDSQDRFSRVTDFNEGKLGDVFVATDALSHGMDVKADLVIHFDKLWNPAKEWQREDRCHGIGRGIDGKVTNVVHLLAAGTIDEGMHQVTTERVAMIRDILDSADEVLMRRFSLDDFKAMIAGRLAS